MTMKKLYAVLVLVMLFYSSFAQDSLKVLFLVSEIPHTEGQNDQIMEDILTDAGFDVTKEVAAASNPHEGHDIVMISETCGSRDEVWAQFKDTPIPLVTFKVHALKEEALQWLDGPGVTNTDYGNSNDSVITVVEPSHPILTGLTGSTIQVADNAGSAPDNSNVCWCVMPKTSGQTVIARQGTTDITHLALIAFEEGTTLGPTTLTSKAVIIGFHNEMVDELNEAGKTIIINSCYWAADKEIVNVSDKLRVQTSIYPNPSSGELKLQFSKTIPDISVRVLSLDGKEVYSKQLYNTHSELIDLSELNAGMYFILMEGSDLSHTEKLILSK